MVGTVRLGPGTRGRRRDSQSRVPSLRTAELLDFAACDPLKRHVRTVDKPKVGGERASERLAEATGPDEALPTSQRRA